mgnify:CR=1 FL=1
MLCEAVEQQRMGKVQTGMGSMERVVAGAEGSSRCVGALVCNGGQGALCHCLQRIPGSPVLNRLKQES